METQNLTFQEYLDTIPPDRREALTQLRESISGNLPPGFKETIRGPWISYCVPHTIYPAGYHCDPKQPLPFISIASQKNFVAVYHMGIYADPALLEWFVNEYPKHCKTKLDMGKSCIRLKKMENIPFVLFAELAKKMTVQNWIDVYESALNNR